MVEMEYSRDGLIYREGGSVTEMKGLDLIRLV